MTCTTAPTATAFIQQCLDNGDKRSDIVEALDAHFGIKKTKAYELIRQVAKDAPKSSVPLDDNGSVRLLPLADQMIALLIEQGDIAEARQWWALAAKARGIG